MERSESPPSANTPGNTPEEPFGVSAPQPSLPKGGGAIRGIGEKFAANPVTGTGTMTVPLFTSPGRAGFGPQLALTYDSGAGNGPFGFGWSLVLPSITRKTDKGLPQYLDELESDVYLLSGSEDLVPKLRRGTQEIEDLAARLAPNGKRYAVRRYRPRVEGLFARIERWMEVVAAGEKPEILWRSISKDNVTAWYGLTPNSRIADPVDPSRVFSWLVCYSHDDKGNAMVYDYAAEDSRGVDTSVVRERNRTEASRGAQRYLKRIRYGNRRVNRRTDDTAMSLAEVAVSPTAGADEGAVGWLFSIVFEYEGEAHLGELAREGDQREYVSRATTQPTHPWTVRKDAFSSYRSGFEVRTYRRCIRALMFHHFPEELGRLDTLVRSTDLEFSYGFEHGGSAIATYLNQVRQRAYRMWEREGDHKGDYFTRAMPALEFEYSEAKIGSTVRDIDAESLRNLPAGVDGALYQWVDLDGQGSSGILSEQGGAWYYKQNLSAGNVIVDAEREMTRPAFAGMRMVANRPNLGLAGGGVQLLDLGGDGNLDVVTFEGASAGFYKRTEDRSWEGHRTFLALPQIDWRDPNLRFVDLNGDGHADLLITENDALVWYPSLAERGFDEARRVAKPLDEEQGPRLIFADGEQAVMLADLSGDGLADLVRIRNGSIDYWPQLGYGRFGAKVSMDDAPVFDLPDQFDVKRLRLADVDGTGTTDVLYLGASGITLFRNLCGNAWGPAELITATLPAHVLSSIAVANLMGNGTASLVWSSPLPCDAARPMKYIDLMAGGKPHLLVRSQNNLGAATRVDYAASTYFYLQDEKAGVPWVTRLPFPVHVVHRVVTEDLVSRSRYVTRYAYHHGYFDGIEREFRGFGMVEQWDTETLDGLSEISEALTTDNVDSASHLPPVHTKTWYHTGAYLDRERISRFYALKGGFAEKGEYFREPGMSDAEYLAQLLDDTVLPDDMPSDEARETCRALKGFMLRQEVYALDGSVKASYPYSVVEQNLAVRVLQGRGPNRHVVVSTRPLETVTYHYERNPKDPRVQHTLTLEVDEFGNVLKLVAIGYGRRLADSTLSPLDQVRQTHLLMTYTESEVTNAIDTGALDEYRTPVQSVRSKFELTGPDVRHDLNRFTLRDFVEADPARTGRVRCRYGKQLSYEDSPTGGYERRLLECMRTRYRTRDLTALLPDGALESRALPGEKYKLAFTPGLLRSVYLRRNRVGGTEALLPDPQKVLGDTGPAGGGYVNLDGDGHWWMPSGRVYYSPNAADDAHFELAYARDHFFLPLRYRNPFHSAGAPTESRVQFDAHDLLMADTQDALGNRVTIGERRADGIVNTAIPGNDYRVLKPTVVMDANRNRTAVTYDVLGMVVGTAVMGKPEESLGDSLEGFEADLDQATEQAHLSQPLNEPLAVLGSAGARLIYDFTGFKRTRMQGSAQSAVVYTAAREIHRSEPGGASSPIHHSFSYSDGFGREIQKKVQAEPGLVPARDGEGRITVDDNGDVQFDKGSARPRWVVSGWTVFNNKGKPTRQYEPFFTDRHSFEFRVKIGVSSTLFYDPLERVVATLHPNQCYDKAIFDSWRQITFDVNDTCAARRSQTGDPRTDPDIGGFVAPYFAKFGGTYAAEWRTWYAQRVDGSRGQRAREAAEKSAVHADTPSVAHLDALGRVYLTLAHNRYSRDGSLVEETSATRVELDIMDLQRAVRDAIVQEGDELGRVVMRYDYDLSGRMVRQESMDAGTRWLLSDVTGKPIRSFDNRGHVFLTRYDPLRRPAEQLVRGTTIESDPRTTARDCIVDRIDYGETVPGAEELNLRTRAYRHWDSAGMTMTSGTNPQTGKSEAYDFKGNALRSSRQVLTDAAALADWSQSPALEAVTYGGSARFDAFNRVVQAVAPHSDAAGTLLNVIQYAFSKANLLERVDVWLERMEEPVAQLDPATEPASPVGVNRIDYDAKAQRQRIQLKNGVETRYWYEPESFRLSRLYTHRVSRVGEDAANDASIPSSMPAPDEPPDQGPAGLQNLSYCYDPIGNITHIEDGAQATLYFRNRMVEAGNDYTYDALYRLICASGREHLGQAGGSPTPYSWCDRVHSGSGAPGGAIRFSPDDGAAMGTYSETYRYDAVGNFIEMKHAGNDPANPGWSRAYAYLEASPTESTKTSNRLTSTQLAGANSFVESYSHDAHGNLTRMPHLGGGTPDQNMHWDYRNRLIRCELGGGGEVQFLYDASGERLRKVWRKSVGLSESRTYLGATEVYVKLLSDSHLERETLQVLDDKQRVALVETRTLDARGSDQGPRRLIRYQFGNHLGSASLELDEGADIISYEEYSPYGSSTYRAVRNVLEAPKRYRYARKERDEETGFNYHSARYYAPWLGRWASSDPSLKANTPNLFEFCNNNPTNVVDDNGEDGTWWDKTKAKASAIYNSAPVQTTVGILEGLNAVRRSIAPTVVEAHEDQVAVDQEKAQIYKEEGGGVHGALVAELHANPIYKAVVSAKKAYKEEGGGGAGVAAIANQYNPLYYALVSGYKSKEAVEKGQYREAGKQGVNSAVGVVGTVAVAVGGAKLITGVVGGGGAVAEVETAENVAGKGAVADANFAQSAIRADEAFSKEGIAKYSEMAGKPINNVNDLAAAIKDGTIKPSQVPVGYVVQQDGTKLIMNTRTSVALDRAGIPKSEWVGTNQTGVPVPGMAGTTFDDLAQQQLKNNKLPPTGSPDIPKGR